jgi:hypothetical protein
MLIPLDAVRIFDELGGSFIESRKSGFVAHKSILTSSFRNGRQQTGVNL